MAVTKHDFLKKLTGFGCVTIVRYQRMTHRILEIIATFKITIFTMQNLQQDMVVRSIVFTKG